MDVGDEQVVAAPAADGSAEGSAGPSGGRGRGRPRAESVEAEVGRILDAATEVFAADGYGGARIDDIAERVGINKAVLYRRFDSKQALFDAALDRALDELRQRLVSAFSSPALATPKETLRHRTRAMFDFAVERPAMFQLIESAGRSPGGGERVRAARRATSGQLSSVMRSRFAELGLPHEQAADIVAAIVYSIPTALAFRIEQEPGWDRDAVVDLVTEFVLGALVHLAGDGRSALEAADGGPPAGSGHRKRAEPER